MDLRGPTSKGMDGTKGERKKRKGARGEREMGKGKEGKGKVIPELL